MLRPSIPLSHPIPIPYCPILPSRRPTGGKGLFPPRRPSPTVPSLCHRHPRSWTLALLARSYQLLFRLISPKPNRFPNRGTDWTIRIPHSVLTAQYPTHSCRVLHTTDWPCIHTTNSPVPSHILLVPPGLDQLPRPLGLSRNIDNNIARTSD